MNSARSVNLALRFLLELAALAAFGYWGFRVGGGTVARIVLGIGAPLLVAIVWGAFVAPKAAVPLPGPATFVLGLAILLLAAVALAAAGRPTLGIAFGAIALINAVLMLRWRQ